LTCIAKLSAFFNNHNILIRFWWFLPNVYKISRLPLGGL